MGSKAERTRNMRYKRPALDSLGWDSIIAELESITEDCDNATYYIENDEDTLLNAFDGDEEEEYEFKMAFADLSGKAYQLQEQLYEYVGDYGRMSDVFDDCTVALIGNRYKTIGYDAQEEDYFSLSSYDQELAFTESGKKIMRMTKQEMLSTIGQCLGITLAFMDVRQSYDYLKSTFDILRDENTSMLKVIKQINLAYESANEKDFRSWEKETKEFENLISVLPEKFWIE